MMDRQTMKKLQNDYTFWLGREGCPDYDQRANNVGVLPSVDNRQARKGT